MIVYICGPMAGHPDLNEPAFRAAAREVRANGFAPLVPHDIKPLRHPGRDCAAVYGVEAAEGGHDGGCYLRADLAYVLMYADSLYVLPGWSRSRGAQLEVLIARLFRIPIDYHPDAEIGGSAVEALAKVYAEIGRQDAKWGQQNHPDGTGSDSRPFAYTDVNLDLRTGEEVAHIFTAACQRAFAEGRGTWRHILDEEVAEAYAETGDALSEELVQVAAVAVQWRAAQQRRNSINLGGLL